MEPKVIFQILLSVSSSMMEIVILVAIGFILRLTGIMDRKTTRKISQIMFYLCTPAFESVAFARAFSIEAMKKLWICPVVALLIMILGTVLGQTCFLFKRDLPSRLGIMASSFYNFASVPFVFVGALVRSNVFVGPTTELETRAFGYVAMFLAPNILATFTYGYFYMAYSFDDLLKTFKKLLNGKRSRISKNVPEDSSLSDLENNPHTTSQLNSDSISPSISHENLTRTISISNLQLIPQSSSPSTSDIVQTYNISPRASQEIDRPSIKHDSDDDLSFKTMLKKGIGFIFNNLITPPVVGMIIAFIISIHPTVKHHALTEPPMIVSNFYSILATLGGGYFELGMFMLGANLSSAVFTIPGESKKKESKQRTKRKRFLISRKRIRNPNKVTVTNEVPLSVIPGEIENMQPNPVTTIREVITSDTTIEDIITYEAQEMQLEKSPNGDELITQEIIEIVEENSPQIDIVHPSEMFAFPELSNVPSTSTTKTIEVMEPGEISDVISEDTHQVKMEGITVIEKQKKSNFKKICPTFIWFIHEKIISKYFIKFNSYTTLLRVIFIKLFLVPLIMLGVVNLLAYYKVISDDPILFLVLLVESSTPCSTTLVMLCNLCGDRGVEMMAELTLYSYILMPFTLIMWTCIFLVNACHYNSAACNL